jgi:hypothetical protein
MTRRVIDEALRNGLPLYEPLAPNHFWYNRS